jgi:signal transduction histidine kinase
MAALPSPENSSRPGESLPGPNRTLVEAEMVASVAWLIRLRWLAGLGVLVGTWSLGALFQLSAATGPLYTIGLGILFYNLLFYLAEQRLARQGAQAVQYRGVAIGQAILDWLAMALLIHFSGGIESPAILFFIFHIIIASIFFPPRAAGTFALFAAVLLGGIVILEMNGLIPHEPIIGFLDSPLYQNRLYVMAVLAFFTSTALISAYLTSSIQKRLRQREEEVILLSEDLRRATVRLQTLNDGARVISSTLDLPQVLNRLVTSCAGALGVRACSIRLFDKSGRRLVPVAAFGLSQAYLDKGPVDAETNLLAREVLGGKIVNIPDASASAWLQYPQEARQEGIRSILSAPLIGKNGPLGILRAYAVEPARFEQEEEQFLAAIAAQGSIAIENALAYQSIEALDTAKSQFVRIITHELRSPVSVIRSLLNTLTGGYAGETSPEQMDILNRANRRVDFLQKLVDDLLDLAAGKTEGLAAEAYEPLSLPDAVRRVTQRFEVPAREKNLSLDWQEKEPGSEPALILANPEGIDRLFNNLISNAIKYTPEGGRVTVEIKPVGGEIRVVVADTGIGIPEESMEHLFEEFYRAPNAKTVEREGTGLGLTIVKDLVNRFGGRLGMHSELGKGTRFTVSFPRVRSQPELAAVDEAASQPATVQTGAAIVP